MFISSNWACSATLELLANVNVGIHIIWCCFESVHFSSQDVHCLTNAANSQCNLSCISSNTDLATTFPQCLHLSWWLQSVATMVEEGMRMALVATLDVGFVHDKSMKNVKLWGIGLVRCKWWTESSCKKLSDSDAIQFGEMWRLVAALQGTSWATIRWGEVRYVWINHFVDSRVKTLYWDT